VDEKLRRTRQLRDRVLLEHRPRLAPLEVAGTRQEDLVGRVHKRAHGLDKRPVAHPRRAKRGEVEARDGASKARSGVAVALPVVDVFKRVA
jgi:hypothetical protein